MKVIIRRPNIKDREELHQLFETTIKNTLELEGAVGEEDFIKELSDDQKNLIDTDFDTDGKEYYFLVAEYEGKIAGTICHRPCSDIIKDCADRDIKGMHEIGSVYILPDFQGKGIAKLLLNAMYITLSAKGFDEFWLDSGYDIAKNVWRNVLGEPTIIMKDYWGEGVDHHLWYRKLSDVAIEYNI